MENSPPRRGPIAACAGYIGMPAENLREILEKLSCRRPERGILHLHSYFAIKKPVAVAGILDILQKQA
jgi:hypothetical protein